MLLPQHLSILIQFQNHQDLSFSTHYHSRWRCLIHLGGSIHIPMAKADIEISLGIRNLSDVKYYNHLSFYRKVEIPEPGRSFQISIKVPFKQLLK